MLLSGYFSLEFLFQARLIFGTKLNKLKKIFFFFFDEQSMSKFSVKKKFSKRNIFKIRILKVTKSKDRPITIKLNIIFTNVIVHFSQIDYFCPNTRLFGFTIDSTVFDFERVCMKNRLLMYTLWSLSLSKRLWVHKGRTWTGVLDLKTCRRISIRKAVSASVNIIA